MSLPRYPEYRESGVEWLGRVPAHWECVRVAALFREVSESGNDELPILSVSIHDGVSDKQLNDDEAERKVSRSEDRSKYKAVNPGDLTYNMMRAWQGGFGTVAVHGMVSPAYVVARPIREFATSLVEMLLRTPMAVSEMKRHSRGITDFRLRLYWEDFKCIQVVLPPPIEQTTIATFLDRETAKIDALIAEQEKLIALLAEKRQATISHAVTRGLDPDVPMKDSGVAWLGEVPGHWECVALKRICDVRDGTHDTPTFVEPASDTYPLVTTKDISAGHISLGEAKHISEVDYVEVSKRSLVEQSDVVMPMIGSIGGAVVVDTNDKFAIKNIALFKSSIVFVTAWLCYILNSELAQQQFNLQRTGGVQAFVGLGVLRNLLIPYPPKHEQDLIAQFITLEDAKLNGLRVEAERAITLLKERRSALIAAAVTGQIDVRGVVSQEVAA